jgi:hypothetical protein
MARCQTIFRYFVFSSDREQRTKRFRQVLGGDRPSRIAIGKQLPIVNSAQIQCREANDEKARQDRVGVGNRYGSIEYE